MAGVALVAPVSVAAAAQAPIPSSRSDAVAMNILFISSSLDCGLEANQRLRCPAENQNTAVGAGGTLRQREKRFAASASRLPGGSGATARRAFRTISLQTAMPVSITPRPDFGFWGQVEYELFPVGRPRSGGPMRQPPEDFPVILAPDRHAANSFFAERVVAE